MRGAWLLALLLTTPVLAGCLGGGEGGDEGDELRRQRAEVTSQLGGIEGSVTDTAIQPIEGINVTLQETGDVAGTAVDGSFAFSKLTPGSYTVVVQGDGFVSQQAEASVQAGDAAVVDFILEPLASQEAYTQQLELAGFFECGAEVGWNISQLPVLGYFFYGRSVCSTPNGILGGNATNDRFAHFFSLDAPIETVVYEMVWDPTNRMSEWMTTRMEIEGFANDGIGTIFRTQGPSPIHVRMDRPVWEGLQENYTAECEEGEDAYCGYSFFDGGWDLQTRVFPAWQCADERGGGCVVVQQEFTHFVSAFYNAPAPDGFAVANGG